MLFFLINWKDEGFLSYINTLFNDEENKNDFKENYFEFNFKNLFSFLEKNEKHVEEFEFCQNKWYK